MKLLFNKSILTFLFIILAMPFVNAQTFTTPKREMRSAWVATVWQLDWPKTKITSTGNATQIAAQKKEMTVLLDSLKANNMNAINFQVRDRCDAFYKSSYEPWSTDLVSTRGMDPGYDPLAFVVEECHKRGMECHAWVNPYRYESVTGQWGSTSGEYRGDHPDWVMDYNNASILNPGKEEVIQRIVDVCKEIISNYDVDGILYDDYFYLSGTPLSADADLYAAYQTAGGTLSQADWRRDNVNRMIKGVYNMIQTVKPWVRFGISPAGVAGSSASVAGKYGLTPCPAGSDWQYSSIYSDPLAWVSSRSLDFISPQIYWTIGSSSDYSAIANWWSQTANKFGRHFYSSHSISSLTSGSTGTYTIAAAASTLEKTLSVLPKASGQNNDSYNEYANEVQLNRNFSLNDAPGSIFYSCKYLYDMGAKESFAHFLKRTVFTKPALMPVMTWKAGNNPGVVKNLAKSAYTLKWDGYDNVRYTVYAVPESVAQTSFNKDLDYLIDMTYNTSFDIPENKRVGYNYAVCVLDRMGNEYSPVFLGTPVEQLEAPTLVSPEDGAKAPDPFDFTWNPVNHATDYTLEIADDAAFTKVTHTYATQSTTVSSGVFSNLGSGIDKYWRVRSCAMNYQDGISAIRKFIPQVLSMTYPTDGATSVMPYFTATWTNGDNGDDALLEISTDMNFADQSALAFSAHSTTGSVEIPKLTLQCSTTYYVRVTMTHNGVSKTTDPVKFFTRQFDANVPEFEYPLEGGSIHSNEPIKITPQIGAYSTTIEVSSTTLFGRSRYVETLYNFAGSSAKTFSEIKIDGNYPVDGQTYYARARATFYNASATKENTDYCDYIQFTYSATPSGVSDILTDNNIKLIGGSAPRLIINLPAGTNIDVKAVSPTGMVESNLFNGNTHALELSLSDLSKGMHLIVVNVNGGSKTLKFIR